MSARWFAVTLTGVLVAVVVCSAASTGYPIQPVAEPEDQSVYTTRSHTLSTTLQYLDETAGFASPAAYSPNTPVIVTSAEGRFLAFSGHYYPFAATVADAATGQVIGDMLTSTIQPELFPPGDLS